MPHKRNLPLLSEPSTTYMISVALLTEDGEGPVEMITAQTKPVSRELPQGEAI